METRFANHNKKALSLGFLLPRFSGQVGVLGKLEEVFDFYEPPFSPFTLQQAKEKIGCGATYGIIDGVTAPDVFDKSVYPVIHRLLKILEIQPDYTASAEQICSCLRR